MSAAITRHVLEPFSGGEASGLRDDVSLVAHLAFGKANRGDQPDGEARHLALLPNESLELDLTDPAQRQLGDYELLELIGEGGMGVVYRARQISLDREVAIKLLAAGPWASLEFVQRFQREAQNAARMQHPNIVAIYEVGDTEELHFFSMQLIRGPSLAAEIRSNGRMNPVRAAQTLRVIAEAVDYAHRLGVLHLDLKPANVLIEENGTPHVADFGLARRLEHGLAADSNEVSGTPSYMAPEQATGGARKITPATDIWGLGAVLYELVTGEPPFLANSAQATLKLVVEGALRSPRRHVPDLPLDIEAIIRKCMTRDVSGRYATARDLADDLTRFIEGREVRARPLNAPMRAWRWALREPRLAITAVLAVLALMIGIASTTQQWRRAEQHRADAEAQKHRAEESAAASSERLWASRREAALRLEKDGNGFEALPQLLANIEEQELSGHAAGLERREFGTLMQQGVTLIDRLIIPDANPMTAALSPDGSLMAVALNDISVRWYDTATLKERGRVDLSDNPTSDGVPHVPQMLRFIDNHRLLVTLEWYTYWTNPNEGDSLLVNLDSASQVRPPALFKGLSHSQFSADGRHALLFGERREVQLWQVEPWAPISPAVPQIKDNTSPYLLLPKANQALRLRAGTSILERLDARHQSEGIQVELPAHEAMTAWTTNSDGTLLVLGDADGQVFITDLVSLKSRRLPLTSGRPVSWIAFSEDDAWIAAARQDGTAFAFDVRSGVPLHAGPLQHEFALSHVAISHRDRLLVASGNGDSALWRLPLAGPGGVSATRIRSGPTRSARAGPYWAGVSMQAGLLVSADFDGEVRLWRLPRLAMRGEESANYFSDAIEFDGDHVPDAAFDQLRVASLQDPTRATPWTPMPGAISFAELTDQAKTLVAVSQHTLYVFDAATMRQRYPPLPLRGDPLRFALAADGTLAVLTFPQSDATGFREQIESFDLVAGAARPDTASVQGPIRHLVISPDARLLIVGPPDGATEVFDAASLHRTGVFPHDSSRPVLWADFAANSSLWLVARSIDPTLGDNAELIHWKIGSSDVLERRNVPGISPVGLMVHSNAPLLVGKDRLIRDPGTASSNSSPRLLSGDGSAVLAASHDRRLIAYAAGRDVQVYDAATLSPIGAPLRTDIGMIDGIAQLAFSGDDRWLLCRTFSHHWLMWNVSSDLRQVAELRRDVGMLPADASVQHILREPEAAERARLRKADPGASTIPEVRPALPVARLITGSAVPARPTDLSPLLLDLSNQYTHAPDSTYNYLDSVLPSVHGIPIGVLRTQGFDYDVRGGIEMRWADGARIGSGKLIQFKSANRGITVPQMPIAALHLLMYAPLPVSVNVEQVYANLVLNYRDGSSATIPLRTNREVPGFNHRDHTMPIGWVDDNDLRLMGEFRQRLLSNPRLANPHPERLIASLDLETAETWSTPVVFAITAEPVIAGSSFPSTP